MAPRATYLPPHKQLAVLMIEARREGLSFEVFWSRALRPELPIVMVTHPDPPHGAIRWPTDRDDRKGWQDALEDTRGGWRRAYERAPATAPEVAVLVIADAIDAGLVAA